MSKPADPLPIETELSTTPYRWIRAIARGGMGEVHEVEHRELRALGALKVLRNEHVDGALVDRLRTEARLLTFITHPNLVRVLDFGWTKEKRPFLVSEMLQGETLGEKLRRERSLPADEAGAIALQVLRGLAIVHAKGIVHRDIKPENLFVTGDERRPVVKILDFGVAKVVSAATRHAAGKVEPTAEGLIVGTPTYVSPEQIMALHVDARTDLYSLGCVLFRMLAGAPPFAEVQQLDLFRAHLALTPRFPAAEDEQTARLQQVALRALEKHPADRFASADAMASAIEAALLPPPRALPPPPQHARTERIPIPDVTERIPRKQSVSDADYVESLRRKRTRPVQPLQLVPISETPTVRPPKATPQPNVLPARTAPLQLLPIYRGIVVLLVLIVVGLVIALVLR